MEVLHDSKGGIISEGILDLGPSSKKQPNMIWFIFWRMELDLDGTRLKTPSEKYCCVDFFLKRL